MKFWEAIKCKFFHFLMRVLIKIGLCDEYSITVFDGKVHRTYCFKGDWH